MNLRHKIANRFRLIVSGSPDGRPQWVELIAQGSGPGLFGPESAVWEVHGSISTLIGGIRALLIQAMHPAALSGVKEHSRYETDALGRLAGTARWLTVTTFASEEAIQQEARRVNAMHTRVNGSFRKRSGDEADYSARDPRYLLWVHCAFTDSFLSAYKSFNATETQLRNWENFANQYIGEWSASAIPLGLADAPKTLSALEAEMQRFAKEELTSSEMTREVVRFIQNPPLGRSAELFYAILFKGTLHTLNDAQLRILGLKRPARVWKHLCSSELRILSWVLGKHSPSQQVAYERIARSE